jgi:tRNA (cmo5U34)-methyltransferase
VARKQDSLYANALDEIIDFRFDEKVVNVFPDMIQRSVPGYATLITNIGVLASRYAQQDSHCYDLGCSLGAVSLAMGESIKQKGCKIIAVDNSLDMIREAQSLLKQATNRCPIELQCNDILKVEIEKASVVVMNFTLQFIELKHRVDLIRNIYRGMQTGGVFILSEKVAFPDQQEQDFHTHAHHDFKRANGYSDLEISQKRTALENVLIPESIESHKQRLLQAGFSQVVSWYQCFNFVSLIAIK